MKTIVLFLFLIPILSKAQSTSIVGQWQLVNQSNCVEDELGEDDDIQDLVEDMKSRSRELQVLEFKSNNSAKESTKIISSKKSYNSNAFLYRLDGGGLYFLDKRSRTIIEGFTVEKLASDTLIISNSTRVCETKIFVRIK